MPESQLTLLNSMASPDFEDALRIHQDWGLEWMDIRDGVYGHWVDTLDVPTAEKARAKIDEAGLKVYCLSTAVFSGQIENGEQFFREQHLAKVEDILTIAKVFEPKVIRLIAAQLPSRGEGESAMDLIESRYPWVVDVYREAVDRIADAGLGVAIENEAWRCFLSRIDDFHRFFEALDRRDAVGLTWDVQNHWATGVFPTLEVYEQLRPLIRYYHTKGGRDDGTPARRLKWNVALEDADWPVVEITQAVVDDGVSPVICLNPTQHGEDQPGYEYGDVAKRDLDFLRTHVKGVR